MKPASRSKVKFSRTNDESIRMILTTLLPQHAAPDTNQQVSIQ